MNTINKVILYIFLFLFLLSVHHDLTAGTYGNNKPEGPNKTQTQRMMKEEQIEILKVQAGHGDTVLSIVERINEGHSESLDISRIMKDFKLLNNDVKPTEIQAEEYYYFPLYK
ncbi:hypothetical protein SAMN05216238_102158 [Lentibacillus persicus]|uniref:LysM domain-containing protein n=1 Tax=Lentibacillus persicus TaxID=640948 RepID=A0A1I1TEB0_9BACI|nr:hypothetical protein [Lentibacillus persicus]SFD54663.1 hypothetical protein SAMN05216238_102158 [Lentibacillus persicus]